MSRVCSICLSESSDRTTPLYSRHGNMWSDTGLSEMVKACNDIKIKKTTDTCALHVICNTCVYKTCLSFFKNHDLSSSSSSIALTKIEPAIVNKPQNNKRKENEEDSWSAGSINKRHVSPDSTNQYNNFPNKKKYRDQKYYVPPSSSSSSSSFKFNNRFIGIDDDCLAKIFMNLSIKKRLEIERVCQKWKDVARSLAWSDMKNIDTNSIIFKHQNNVEKIITRCGSHLRYLNINKLCESNIILTVKKYCINLNNLILHLDNYDEQDFVDAFTHMNNLQSIEIKFKDLSPKTLPISPPRLLQSLNNNNNIENIIISSFWIDSSRTIYYPAPSFETFCNLRYLKITACYLDNISLADISKCKKLVNLKLIRCKISENNLFISQLPNLKNLELIQSGVNIDDFLIDLRYESRNLEHLDIGGTTSVSSKALGVLSKFKKLKYLDIGLVKNVDDSVIIKISNECKYIEYINIRECSGVSETAIKYLIKKCDNLGKIDASMTGHSLGLLVATAKIIKKRKTNTVLKFVSRSSLITRFYRLKNATSFLSTILEFSHHPDDEQWGYDYNYDYQDEYNSDDSDDSNDSNDEAVQNSRK